MNTRRDFIKWVLYLGSMAALPEISAVADVPHDVLEGISRTNKRIADFSGNNVAFRMAEDEAFETAMRLMWQEHNGTARYLRVFNDLGIQPAYTWADPETGEVYQEPEAYVSSFQYRRA